MYDIKATNVPLTVCDHTGTTHVTTTSNHDNISSVEWNEINNLVLFKIKLNGIIDTDQRIRITNCSAIVSHDVRDATTTDGDLTDFEKFVTSLLGCDTVNGETTLNIVKETEVFPRLLNGNDVYEESDFRRHKNNSMYF